MLVKFRGSDDTFEIKAYAFSKPKCYICQEHEDTYGRTLDLWYCEEMRIFWCRDHKKILDAEHQDVKRARCYNGNGWFHKELSGVVNADTE